MLAIKSGKSGEGKLKKYEPFKAKVASSDGTLDIASLVSLKGEKAATPTNVPEPLVLSSSLPEEVKCDMSPPSSVNTPPDSAVYNQSPQNMVSISNLDISQSSCANTY